MTRRPASLHMVCPVGSPLLRRYYQGAATPGRPSRLASSSFARRYHAAACGSLPRTTNGKRPRTRRLVWLALGRFVVVETSGSPTFLGNPLCLCPALRPRQDRRTWPIRYADAAPAMSTTKAPALQLSRLNHTASALAVYASQEGSLPHHARLASGCQPSSTGRDWLPAGFQSKGFKDVSYISSSFAKFRGARTSLISHGETVNDEGVISSATARRTRGTASAVYYCGNVLNQYALWAQRAVVQALLVGVLEGLGQVSHNL